MNPIALMQLMKKIRPPNPDDLGEEEANAQAASLPELKPIEEKDPLEEEGPAFRALRDNTAKAPSRDDYKPSLGRSIAAALLAGAQSFTGGAEKGIALGQSIKNAPFDNAQGDFQRKQKSLGDLASLEETDAKRRGSLFDRKNTLKEKEEARVGREKDRALTREQIAANQALLEHDREADNARADRALTEGHADREASRADRRSFHEDAIALGNRNATTAEERAKHVGIKDKTPQLDRISQQFDNHPITKKYNILQDAHNFVTALDPKTSNPGDDQGLIYSFAKAMDPDSAVREGEYKTVQKYAQSWLASMGFNAERVLSGTEFLTPEARANLKKTIETKYGQLKNQHKNLAAEFGRKIDRHTGGSDGADYLTNYDMDEPKKASGLSAERKAQIDAEYFSQGKK